MKAQITEFEQWDEKSGTWGVAAGGYEILVGQHSLDLAGTRVCLE
jgi:hypothetical protein